MAVLFDLDGTLLDTAPDFHAAANALLLAEKMPLVDLPTVKRHISFGSKHILAGTFNLDLNDKLHKTYVDQLLPRFIDAYVQTKFINTKPFVGIDQLLENIEQSGYAWGIVTNKNKALTEPLLQATGYANRTECVICGDATPNPKPAPDHLLLACEILKVKPKDCIFVGDSINDVLAGKAAGMRTIAAGFGFIPESVKISDWQADVIVNEPNEILSWIEKWLKPTN